MSDAPRQHEERGTERGPCGDAAAYALGALEGAEAEAFALHLRTCAVCRDELATFRQTTDALALGVPRFQTPPQLRHRVLGIVRAEARERSRRQPGRSRIRRSRAWRPALPSPRAAIGLAAVVLAATAVLAGVLAGGGPSSRVISASVVGVSGQARVRIQGEHAQLIVRGLPAPSAGHIYEVWLQRGSSAPRPSSLFGRGNDQVDVEGSIRGVSRLLVTLEPAPGTSRPTSRPLVIADV